MKTYTGLEAVKYILDPIHKSIPITPLELQIISKPTFQRLRKISQLGFASLVFPGAIHTRFQHSLGTMHIMDRLLANLDVESTFGVSHSDAVHIIQYMRLIGLLHDIGHLPFSHTLEKLLDGFNHENIGEMLIQKSTLNEVLDQSSFKSKDIGLYIANKTAILDTLSPYLIKLKPLIDSEIDADRMDYLLRDAYYSGTPYGNIDLDRIANFIRIKDDKICFNEKAQNAIDDFLYARYQMYNIVYTHKTNICYDLIANKIYSNYLGPLRGKLHDLFLLPLRSEFENATQEWIDHEFYYLTEDRFFQSINSLLRNNTSSLSATQKKDLANLYSTIINRTAIPNCFRFDPFTEIQQDSKGKREYCDLEALIFEAVKKEGDIIPEWSFLRNDPSKPISITSSLSPNIEDDQDPQSIRICTNEGTVESLISRPNSIIKNLATHHRILISYYCADRSKAVKIQRIAQKILNPNDK